MKKLVLLCFVVLTFFFEKTFASSTNKQLDLDYSHLVTQKSYEDETVGYYYGYLLGSNCLHLFRISIGSRIDYTGRSIVTYDVSTVTEFNSEGFVTTICPEDKNEWFV